MILETNIGLEIHVQLKTKSKMFCGCDNNSEGKAPNSLVCPICMGFPGVLPVANRQAIEWTIKTALALNCQIAKYSKFDRKHYFYPDLPKNYQISQYDLPFAYNGWLEIKDVDSKQKKVRIRRIHLEEDAAKLVHPKGASYSLVDFNRAGTPLMEIVTEPDITSPSEARLFLQELRRILRYLNVSDADMEKGHLRCDANISIHPVNTALGTPVEIKNMNSFKMVEKALLYEQERQKQLLQKGITIKKETRGWVDERKQTVSQRSKEEAPDYRYFPEPDLPPFRFSSDYIQKIRNSLCELPAERKKRFIANFHLTEREADTLVEDKGLADYFENVVALNVNPKKAANWILVELLGRINKRGITIAENRVLPGDMAALIKMIDEGRISGKIAKEVFEQMFETGKAPSDIIKESGLATITDQASLSKIIKEVIDANKKAVSDYKQGKETALQFLLGQVMYRTKGQAEPQSVLKILKQQLNNNGQNQKRD